MSESVTRILAIVADEFGCTVDDLLGLSRDPEIVAARHTAMFAIARTLQLSICQTGRAVGRDHATVSSVIRRFHRVRAAYPEEVATSLRRARAILGRYRARAGDPVADWAPRRDLGRTYVWGGRRVRAVAWHPARQLVAVTYRTADGRERGALVAPDDLCYAGRRAS